MFLTNAFSFNMVAAFPAVVHVDELTLEETKALVAEGFTSAVGHADTANVFADQLGLPVPSMRATISLNKGDEALIGQYRGPRLPEGATTLPDGATIQWLRVTIR